MTNFEFNPDKKRPGKNKYVGSWSETNCTEIKLPFTEEALVEILRSEIDRNRSTYTHQEIAHWCGKFRYANNDNSAHVTEVAGDIEAQWEMYLANTYSLEELQSPDFSKISLPIEWFESWLNNISA